MSTHFAWDALMRPPDTRPALSPRQEDFLAFIRSYTARNGWPPTTREMGTTFGFASVNGVHCHLRALEKKGYIRREPSRARAITIL